MIGITLMAVGCLTVPIVDAIAKALSADMSPFFLAFSRYVVAAVVIVPVSIAVGNQAMPILKTRTALTANATRTVLAVGSMTSFYFAIKDIPLATAFGGYFLGPIVASALAAIVVGERVTLPRIASVVMGLLGGYFIVQPDINFKIGSAFALLSGLLFAGYLLSTRVAASTTPPLVTLGVQSCLGCGLLLPFALANWAWPSQSGLVLLIAMGLIAVCCNFLVIAAFRYAETMVLSPLAYLELVTATMLGAIFFAELPDRYASVGIMFVVGSGVLTWWGERSRDAETR